MRWFLALVLAILTFGAARVASAQAVILGSTAVGRLGQTSNLEPGGPALERAPRFAVCDDKAGCRGLHPYKIEMEVYPHWELRLPMPKGFMLTNHNWTSEQDTMRLSLRQAMVGGTVRYQPGDLYWVELGGALAEQSISRPAETELLSSGDVGRMLPALLAGVGGWIHLNPRHCDLDVRLRGGMSFDDGGAPVYHADFVIALGWW